MLSERRHKNEDVIKDMIVKAHRNGTCDSTGASVKNTDGMYITKPRFGSSSAVKTYIYRNGRMVLKNG